MSQILIVDDEPAICWAFREALTEEGHAVDVAPSAEEALAMIARGQRPELVVLDVRLPGRDGLSVMRELRHELGEAPVVVMTAFGSLDTAVRALEQGAFDYLVKPFDLDNAVSVLKRALAAVSPKPLSGKPTFVASPSRQPATLLGASPVMQQVFKQIALVAPSTVSVLITGESGTGKELVARAIHRHGGRKEGPFVPVCIPALNPGLVESELFGHVRGAFTGAHEARSGLIEQANAGTLFLDEIAEVSPPLQVKLLRMLEQREVYPVGSATAVPVDVRVVAATNRSLEQAIAKGDFREDLFFRLGAFRIPLPALRDRPGDVSLLAHHFLLESIETSGRGATGSLRFSAAALGELERRSWPGNVRELRNAVEHAAIVARGGEIEVEHLPSPALAVVGPATTVEELRTAVTRWAEQFPTEMASPDAPGLHDALMRLVEPAALSVALKKTGGNKAAAAQLLGLHRGTLRQKLRDFGMDSD